MIFSNIRDFIHTYFLAVLVTLLLLGLSIITFFEAHKRVQERNSTLFAIRAETAKNSIEKRMQDYIQILKGGQALFVVSDTVRSEEWINFVQILDVEANYPGILGIGYSHVLEAEEVSIFEKRIRANGFPDFKVWPGGDRSVYTTVLYLEPFNERNRRAFGYDMFTDSIRQKAMARARDTGQPFLTGMVRLVQETDQEVQNGFLLYLPLYYTDTIPKTVQKRRKSLRGFVYAPFRINDLIDGILGKRFKELDIEIYDGTLISKDHLLYDSRTLSPNVASERKNLISISPLRIAGHTWQLYIRPTPAFGEDSTFPWMILGGGLLFSGLIFIIIYSLTNIRQSTYLRQLITDNATASLFILDRNDVCTFINPAAESLLGYTLDELQDDTFHNKLHYKHPDGTPYPAHDCPIIKSLISVGSIYKLESILYNKSGDPVQVSINAQPIYEGRRVVSHLLEVRDIGPEKEAENILHLKNKNLQTLNTIAENLLAELELNKLIQFVTDSCTELTGAQFGAFFYTTQDEKGKNLMLYALSGAAPEAFNKFPLPRATQVFAPTLVHKKIIRSDDITQDERYGKNKPHSGMPIGHLPVKSYLAVPVISRGGEVLGSLFFGHAEKGIFTENAEVILKGIAAQAAIAIDNSRMFETLSHKNLELLKINNDLDNFVYTASHDLKAPVLNIEGLVYALSNALEKNNPDRILAILHKIQLSIKKFKDTIQALTEVAKTNKNLEDDLEQIDVKELLDDIIFSISDMVQVSGATIEMDLQEPEIRFSTANLKSIFHNLLTNAIKYKSPERAPLIQISSRKREDVVEIIFKDNGMGFDASYLPKLFTMFSRYHTHVEGTGIGLYLVKRIIENNNGSIEVDSTVGEGTSFTIRLPAYETNMAL